MGIGGGGEAGREWDIALTDHSSMSERSHTSPDTQLMAVVRASAQPPHTLLCTWGGRDKFKFVLAPTTPDCALVQRDLVIIK